MCPGREGPIFFGDSDTRYVLSYTFHLQDAKARGGRRLYSIIVVSSYHSSLYSIADTITVVFDEVTTPEPRIYV